MINNIGIIGAGGVGGYFGAKLCQLQKTDKQIRVKFLARGEHLGEIQSNGLKLKSAGHPDLIVHPFLATEKPEDLGRLDLALVSVKGFDLDNVLNRLKGSLTESTLILPLLNGVDIHARIRRLIKVQTVLPSCVYIGTHIERPGIISQSGGACKILFGPDPDTPDANTDELIEILTRAGIKHEWKPGIQSDIWEKFIFIAAYGLVTATHRATLGDVLSDSVLKGKVIEVMNEAASLARGQGVRLDRSIVENSFEKGRNFPAETKTSFQRDFELAKKPDERELFAGSMIDLGKQLNIRTPQTQHLYQILNELKPVFW